MHYDDPNRRETLKDLRPVARDLDPGPAADAAHTGYERVARRPRTPAFSDIVPEERATRIEEMFASPMLDID